ncbi:hypothetical protein HOO65_090146 [Ceratocystis lukuohia]|uniref:Zn(2)-C6 fungal-type domain-containing protein n=1 Tax=Ceratocystis lukuohia TaxID=2019550 RepID=A0ABR4M9A5_9PEZI
MGEVIVQPDLQPALGQGNMPDMQYNLVEHRLIEHNPTPTSGQGDMLQIQQNFMQQVPEQSLMNSAPLVSPDVFEPNGAVPKALSLVPVPPYLHCQQMASVWHNYVMPEDNHLDLLADQNMIPPNECHAMPDIDLYPSSYNHEGQQHPHQGSLPPTPPPDNYCAEAQQPLSQDLVLLETPSDNESTTNVSRSNQPEEQPLKKLRSPFSKELRDGTAATRRIGSCIRCQMQRIRCEPNEQGECATCKKARPNTKFWRLPCLRYRITEVELYKPLTSVQNLAWTKRGNAELLVTKQFKWQSDQIRTVCLADGHTNIPIKLIVRRFFPKDGDKMKRTWVTSNGELRSVDVTPFAISDPKAAYEELDKHLSKMTYECMQKVVRPLGEVMFKTYSLAPDAIQDSQVSYDEKKLLGHTLKLWMSIRLTTTSQHVVGEDTLDMQSISDDTSPLYGKVPVSPVLGAQLDTLLIDRIQYRLRNDVLKLLQKMIQRNKKQEWFSLYLAIFIILHNIALIIAHDARYARKHGLKRRYARPEKVQEYHKGANTLLAYFHYTNKTYYPFSAKCKDEDLKSLAQLDDKRMQLIRDTREYKAESSLYPPFWWVTSHHMANKVLAETEAEWKEMREQGQNDNDFFYVSQLFQEGWKPMDIDASASA